VLTCDRAFRTRLQGLFTTLLQVLDPLPDGVFHGGER